MIVKVCGMRESNNIFEVSASKPDLMGFIFYPKSKRFVGEDFNPEIVKSLMPEIQTTGVFVNELQENLFEKVRNFGFDFVQLHGTESPVYCREVKKHVKVLKAFGIRENFDWSTLLPYLNVCDFFLFDTGTKGYGGSGEKFDWNILSNYKLNKPFMLSGGIGPNDVESILNIRHPKFIGIDVNSCFELEPGLKNVQKLNIFIKELKEKQ